MEPRNPGGRKSGPPGPGRDRRPRGLLSVRSALVLGFAVLTALGGAGLLYAAHRPVALVVLGAVGIFAAALKLFDSMIELKPWPPVVSRSGRSRGCLASPDVTAVGRGRAAAGWRESAGNRRSIACSVNRVVNRTRRYSSKQGSRSRRSEMGSVLSAEVTEARETARDVGDAGRMAHNPATTGNVSARQYVATTKRNRRPEVGQRRITRGMLAARTRSSCTDSTGHSTDDTCRAGIIRQLGPRTGPRSTSALVACSWVPSGSLPGQDARVDPMLQNFSPSTLDTGGVNVWPFGDSLHQASRLVDESHTILCGVRHWQCTGADGGQHDRAALGFGIHMDIIAVRDESQPIVERLRLRTEDLRHSPDMPAERTSANAGRRRCRT